MVNDDVLGLRKQERKTVNIFNCWEVIQHSGGCLVVACAMYEQQICVCLCTCVLLIMFLLRSVTNTSLIELLGQIFFSLVIKFDHLCIEYRYGGQHSASILIYFGEA